tara:strand:- start:423 stop:1277 length:855 start_codon:yes stop_codon:yes gene_type:complete
MIITESRLKEIITEEVAINIIGNEIRSVIKEMNLGLSKQQAMLIEKTVMDQIKDAAAKYSLPIFLVAAIGFGSEIADRESMESEASAMAASRIKQAVQIGAEYEEARLQALKDAIKKAGLEGKIPPDLLSDLNVDQSPDEARDIRGDILDTEYVQKGKYLEHPADLHTNALVDGEVVAVPLVYVPYETLPDGYRDTFTGGAKKEDLQNSYLRMDIERLGKTVEDVKNFGTHGLGEFDLVYLDGDESKPAKLLPTSFSAALDALMQKNADRGVKGKDTYKPELYQ